MQQTPEPLDRFGSLLVMLFNLLAPLACLVTIVFWLVIFPAAKHHGPIWTDLHAHALNSLSMMTEVWLGKILIVPVYLSALIGFAAYYVGFSFILFHFTGLWCYDFIDPAKGNIGWHYLMLSALAIILFFVVWALVRLRDWIAGKYCGAFRHHALLSGSIAEPDDDTDHSGGL